MVDAKGDDLMEKINRVAAEMRANASPTNKKDLGKEPKLPELIPLAMMMICGTFISQTSNSSSSGSRQAREELKKRKIIYIQFPR